MESCFINGDSLSFELLLINLLRNGLEAAGGLSGSGGQGAAAGVCNRGEPQDRVTVRVWNVGEELSDSELSRLTSLNESIKPGGSGLDCPLSVR